MTNSSDKKIKKKRRPRGKIGPRKEKAGQLPSRALFEDGTYDINNFHDVFLQMQDMTEYKPAIKLCGSWKEWDRLKRSWPTFKSYIAEWKAELEIKLRSDAVQKIIDLAQGDDSKALQAARFISESGWDKRSGKGRPSKAEKEKAAKEIARTAAETKAEENRILKVIGGGKE